jgi:tetratricopeptide (TPR) repeat protein
MSPRRQPKPLKPRDAKRLDQIEELINRRSWDEAQQAIYAFTRKNPDVVDGWLMQIQLGDAIQQPVLVWLANRHLLALEPHEETHQYNAVVTSLQLAMPFATWGHIKTYLERWPNGLHTQKVRAMLEFTEQTCQEMLETDEMAKHADPADMALFEESQVLVSAGYIKEGLPLSLQAAKKLPHAPAPRNNISLSYAVQGKLDQAVALAQEVLEDHPLNIHARCNLAAFLVRLGRDDEARPILDALRAEAPENPDHWGKIVDAFAHAGDETGVIEVFTRATHALKAAEHDDALSGVAQHLAAVAYARQGNLPEAQRLWQAARQHSPSLDLIWENMTDARHPTGEQNGAWYFAFNQWVTHEWIQRLERAFSIGVKRGDLAAKHEVEKALNAIPELAVALAILLDRGDPVGRKLALHVAAHYPLRGLREFALGQIGTDAQRWEAARYASEHGLIDTSKPVTLYVQGEPRDLMLLGFEIHDEWPEDDLTPEIDAYMTASLEALQAGDIAGSLAEIEAGLQVIPNNKVLLNQKRIGLNQLGREAEADALTRQVFDMHPDYLFARCAMARLLAREGNPDEAEQLITPLLQRQRLHHAEFNAVAAAQIDIHQAAGRIDAARSWLQMWQQADPDSVPPALVQSLAEAD